MFALYVRAKRDVLVLIPIHSRNPVCLWMLIIFLLSSSDIILNHQNAIIQSSQNTIITKIQWSIEYNEYKQWYKAKPQAVSYLAVSWIIPNLSSGCSQLKGLNSSPPSLPSLSRVKLHLILTHIMQLQEMEHLGKKRKGERGEVKYCKTHSNITNNSAGNSQVSTNCLNIAWERTCETASPRVKQLFLLCQGPL